MDFDKESFLAGLAVGRAMWQPPITEDSNQSSQPLTDDADDTEDEDAV